MTTIHWSMMIFFIATLSTEIQCQNFDCPIGSAIFQSKCYEYIDTSLDWESAEIYCNSFGINGHLAAIVDGFLNNFLAGIRFDKMI